MCRRAIRVRIVGFDVDARDVMEVYCRHGLNNFISQLHEKIPSGFSITSTKYKHALI